MAGGRLRTLRASLSWGYDERLTGARPLRLMRGPGRAVPRRPLTDAEVHALLRTAEHRLVEAHANHPTSPEVDVRCMDLGAVQRAEQDLLLVRVAPDSGARRGELAALQVDDLIGRVLRIERAVSAGQLTTPKSGHGRTLTLGTDTGRPVAPPRGHPGPADFNWQMSLVGSWRSVRGCSPRMPPTGNGSVLGHRFARIRDAAEVTDATLHRLRHTVATFLVGQGKILQAQARLGHADAATTLREYSHALPTADQTVADAINTHLDRTTTTDDPVESQDRFQR